MKQLGRIAAALALGAVLAVPAIAQEKVSVRLKWLGQTQFAGLYVAKAKGFYKADGLDVTINPGGPNLNAESLVASGADSFAWSSTSSAAPSPSTSPAATHRNNGAGATTPPSSATSHAGT